MSEGTKCYAVKRLVLRYKHQMWSHAYWFELHMNPALDTREESAWKELSANSNVTEIVIVSYVCWRNCTSDYTCQGLMESSQDKEVRSFRLLAHLVTSLTSWLSIPRPEDGENWWSHAGYILTLSSCRQYCTFDFISITLKNLANQRSQPIDAMMCM